MVELAVIPTAAVRLPQRQDRDLVGGGERLHVATEPVADLLDRSPATASGCRDARSRNRSTCPPTCKSRTYAFRQQPIHALDLQRDMTIEHVVDVHHARHATQHDTDRAGSAGPHLTDQPPRGGPGGGPALPPLATCPGNSRLSGWFCPVGDGRICLRIGRFRRVGCCVLSGRQVESLWDEVLPVEVRGAAGGSGGAGRAAGAIRRCWRRSRQAWEASARGGRRAADDRDGDVRAVDGGQAAHRLGL